MNGKTDRRGAEVLLVTPTGLLLTVEGQRYFASFHDFPFLETMSAAEVFKVEYCGHGHIRWESADVDLHTDILSAPGAFPISFQGSARAVAAWMGALGGMARTERKAAASRTNGRKGGRPKKEQPAMA